MNAVQSPDRGATWVALTSEPLVLEPAMAWATTPSCGAVVSFSGTARDHSTGRHGIEALEYEAYDDEARRRLQQVADEARTRWPAVERLVLLHRLGRVELGEAAVLVVAAAPHRGDAFDAARWAIDTLKATVPLWKREHWPGGADWALETQPLADVPDTHPVAKADA
jgi:molybdopterin synthase catalytic subunit